ncbi:MAG: right-handed parallel beta-helix repeat-containing protein [Geminicoccaceae bacterium]
MDNQEKKTGAGQNGATATPPAGLLSARYKISVGGRSGLQHDRAIATDKENGERVFLKWSGDADAIEREAAILEAFSHPGIVGLRNIETNAQGGLLVLDLIDGIDLEAWLQTAGQDATDRDLEKLFASLSDVITAIHAAGFIHRDLKPANILIRPDGSPVIVDFGAAAGRDDRPGEQSLLTDGYAAPEQYMAGVAEGLWTDVYGLAAVAFRAINGRPPPSAPTREIGETLVQEPTSSARGKLARAIEAGLMLDPEARPRSPQAWRDLLSDSESMPVADAPSTDTLDDYPPTIKVERRPVEGHRTGGVRAARAHAAPPQAQRSSSGWRWLAWMTVFGLAAFAAFWFGRPYYERYVKQEWVVDAAGGGDVTSIGDALERARDGAVLMIRPGSYRESLEIVRPVQLIATDAEAPPEIIAENAPCLQTSGRGSKVSGLTLRAVAAAEPAAGDEPFPCLQITGGNLAIEASTIEGLEGPAVVIGDGASTRITGSRIVGGDGLTVLIRGGAKPEIEDNEIEGGDGVLFVEGARGIFSTNKIGASRSSALRLAIGADPVIKDNAIEASGEAGIFVYDGGRGRIEGNSIEGSKLSGVIVGEGADVVLSANRIEGSGEHGILVLDGGRAQLDDNAAIDNSGYGFAFAWEAEVELGVNELTGNKAPDLFDARLARASIPSTPIATPPGSKENSP